MALAKILWVDEEMKVCNHKNFLEGKGYEVHTQTNGFDAIDYVKENFVDVVLIDVNNAEDITGLKTIAKIKRSKPAIPIVLTKNETENLMNITIGSQISDYLIKPVNPNQVLLSLKKFLMIRDWWLKKQRLLTSNSFGIFLWR
jgi:DNA-binding NtrC family response regulator